MKTCRWLWLCALGSGLALALLWIVVVKPRSAHAAILCVNSGGTGGCYASIQQAVTAAGDGDTIQVAQGVYTETVVISKSLTLEGGWNADFSVRDWENYVTTIDADGNGSVIRTDVPFAVPAITVTVEGFTLVQGDDSAGLGWGGGLQLRDRYAGVSQFYVRHNVISNNYACRTATCQGQGGGIYVYGGSAVIEDNFIGNNTARWEGGGQGGGIAVGGYADVTIERNTIISNTAVFSTTGLWAGKGGGLDLQYAGTAVLRDNEIRLNIATVNGTGYGGGIYANGHFYNNLIAGNTASTNDTGYGGGVYAYHVGDFERNTVEGNYASRNGDGTGGGIYVLYMQNAGNNRIVENEARRGGGVYFEPYAGSQAFHQNFVSENRATGVSGSTQDGGGGIASAADWVEISGNTIISNTAYYGGGLQILEGDRYLIQNNQVECNFSAAGGGIFVENAAGAIIANTIISNTAQLGGGIGLWPAASPAVERNIIISNTAEGLFSVGGGGVLINLYYSETITLTNNLIALNAAGSGGHGGGVECWRGSCTLIHNTIVDNDRGTYQEGVILGSSSDGGSFSLRNNLIVGHSTGVELFSGAATSDYNAFYDNMANLDGIALGTHDLDLHDDPQFADRSGGDFHLSLTSPVIDRGDGSLGIRLDFEADPRPHGSGVDIGADEAYRADTYVSRFSGKDAPGDGSPGNPFATILKGLQETRTGGSVHVGRGLYPGTVRIERSVNLLGGYNESDWSRDITAYETVLDAQNLATVVFIGGEEVLGLVEGFTIMSGEASVYGMGGGILVIDNAAAIIRYNNITGNHALNGGGGIALWGNEDIQSLVDSNKIFGNVSDGVFTYPVAGQPLGPQQGPEPGGGIFIGSPARVVNNMIYGNRAGAGGDGLAVGGWSRVQVLHNTLAENGESDGEGISLRGSDPGIEIYNNLIVGHGVGISTTASTQTSWDYNGLYNNGLDYASGLPAGLHDVRGDPFFVDTAVGNYHIGVASSAVGRGIQVGVAVDFDGDARPAPPASSPDIGADEITQGRIYLPLIKG